MCIDVCLFVFCFDVWLYYCICSISTVESWFCNDSFPIVLTYMRKHIFYCFLWCLFYWDDVYLCCIYISFSWIIVMEKLCYLILREQIMTRQPLRLWPLRIWPLGLWPDISRQWTNNRLRHTLQERLNNPDSLKIFQHLLIRAAIAWMVTAETY